MSIEQNKTVVRRFITEVLQNGDMTLIDQLCAPNYVNRSLGGQGLEYFKPMISNIHSAFSDYHLTIDNLIAEGDEVVARITMVGKFTGPLMGTKPSGKAFSVRGLTYYRLANGMIVEDDPITNQDLIQMLGIKLPVAT